jgi:hypothetical protein
LIGRSGAGRDVAPCLYDGDCAAVGGIDVESVGDELPFLERLVLVGLADDTGQLDASGTVVVAVARHREAGQFVSVELDDRALPDPRISVQEESLHVFAFPWRSIKRFEGCCSLGSAAR